MRGAFYNLVNFINTTSINDVYANAARKILQNIYVIPGSTITDVAELSLIISCPKGSIYIKVKKCLKLILIIF